MKPVFINGFWRAVVNGIIQNQMYSTKKEAAENCK